MIQWNIVEKALFGRKSKISQNYKKVSLIYNLPKLDFS